MPQKKKIKIKIRKVWLINPASRVKKSKKIYCRRKAKSNFKRVIEDEL